MNASERAQLDQIRAEVESNNAFARNVIATTGSGLTAVLRALIAKGKS